MTPADREFVRREVAETFRRSLTRMGNVVAEMQKHEKPFRLIATGETIEEWADRHARELTALLLDDSHVTS